MATKMIDLTPEVDKKEDKRPHIRGPRINYARLYAKLEKIVPDPIVRHAVLNAIKETLDGK